MILKVFLKHSRDLFFHIIYMVVAVLLVQNFAGTETSALSRNSQVNLPTSAQSAHFNVASMHHLPMWLLEAEETEDEEKRFTKKVGETLLFLASLTGLDDINQAQNSFIQSSKLLITSLNQKVYLHNCTLKICARS